MSGAFRAWRRTVTDVRREEIVPAVLMFSYGFLVLTSYYIAKAVRNAVFVQRVGADNLPYVYVLTALLVTVVVVVYSRFVDRVEQTTLLHTTFALMTASLLLFWWLLRGESSTLTSGAFYVFIKLYGLLLVSQFWLVGNVLFTTSQARRLFGLVGLGLLLGGVCGGVIADAAVSVLGSENLLLGAALMLVPCAGLVGFLAPRIREGESASGRLMEDITGDALAQLRESSHLRTVAWILGLTIVVSTMIDWELNKAVELFVTGEDRMTAFWGRFFAIQNVASLLIQVVLTSWVLQSLGVGAGLLVLPVGLLLMTVGVIAVPALLTAAFVKGTEGALRYSLDQSARELLYLPVPAQVRYKVKPLIDLAVYRGGTGVAGVILLVTTGWLGFSIRRVGILSLVAIGIWLRFALKMRSEFRESVKRLIGIRDVKLDELIYRRLDADTVAELRRALRGGDERRILYALSLLEHRPPPEIADELRDLIAHDSPDVRARALALLTTVGTGEKLAEARDLLHDPSLEVRAEAIRYLLEFGERDPQDQLRELHEAPEGELRAAVLAYLFRHGTVSQRAQAREAVRELARHDDPDLRRAAARLLAEVAEDEERLGEVLIDLLEDEAIEVRHRAMRTAAELLHEPAVPLLLARLARPEDRRPALETLRRYGPDVEPQLLDRLADPDLPVSERRSIPRLLRPHASQDTVDRLLEIQGMTPPGQVRYEIVKTLNHLRRNRPDLDFEGYEVQPLVEREVREAHHWYALWRGLTEPGVAPEENLGSEARLLVHTLEQRYLEAVERALRTLGLRHPLEDLRAAYAALLSPEVASREQGFELLENTLPLTYRRLLNPLLNPGQPPERKMEALVDRYGFEWFGPAQILDSLASDTDPWIAVLALRCRGEVPLRDEVTHRVALLRNEVIPREGVTGRTLAEEMGFMEILERAEFLRTTDLFSDLRTEDLAALAALAEERTYPTDEFLFREGVIDPGLHFVLEGEVVVRWPDSREKRLGSGESVGELATLGGYSARYSAVARVETRTLRLSRQDLLEALAERFRLVRSVLRRLATRFEELERGSLPE